MVTARNQPETRARRGRLSGYAGVLALVSGLTLLACNAILGIGDAAHDPSLDSDAGVDGGDDCTTYCSLMTANCKVGGQNGEYETMGVCLAMCQNFEHGQPGNTGDTLACRLDHARKTATDPTECQKGGPLATGCSGTSPCHPFCFLDYYRCSPVGLFPYDGGTTACEAACQGYTYNLAPDASDVGMDSQDGNTLNCRLFHLENAYADPSDGGFTVHCQHTGMDSLTCHD